MRTKIPYYSIEFSRIKTEIDNDNNRKTDRGEVLFRSLKMNFLEKETFIFNGYTNIGTVDFPLSHVHGIRSLR